MTRFTTLLTVVAATAALAAGCGDTGEGSDGESSGASVSVTTSSLTPEQYAKRADELCQKGRGSLLSRAAAYEKRHGADNEKRPHAVAYARFIQAALLPYLRDELEKLRALGAPEGDEETVEAILAAQQAAIADVAQLEELSDKEGALESHFAEANRLMRDYGIEECTAR